MESWAPAYGGESLGAQASGRACVQRVTSAILNVGEAGLQDVQLLDNGARLDGGFARTIINAEDRVWCACSG